MAGKKRPAPRRVNESQQVSGRNSPARGSGGASAVDTTKLRGAVTNGGAGGGGSGSGGGTGDPYATRRTDPGRRAVAQVSGPRSQGGRQATTARPASGGRNGSAAAKARSRQSGTAYRPPSRGMSPAKWGYTGGGVVVLAALVIVLALVVFPSKKNTAHTSALPASLVTAVTHVPQSVLNTVGIGGEPITSSAAENAVNLLKTKHATGNGLPPVDGKPVVFFYGALWCPFCATERWGIIIALSRFGTFKNLSGAVSSSTDSFPNTQSFSFHGATYTSKYIHFEPVETEDENKQPLDPLSSAQIKVLKTWDPGTEFPFLTIGTKYAAGLPGWLSPQLLQGLTRADVAKTLSEPSNLAGQAIDANANYLTAAICNVDGQKPGSVCSSKGVQGAAKQLKKDAPMVPITSS